MMSDMIRFLPCVLIAASSLAGQAPNVNTSRLDIASVVVVRLKNQTDMLAGLQEAIAREKIKNAVIMSGFGSVTKYHVHVVGNTTFPPKDVFSKESGPYDLLTVSGLVMNGRLHCHITLASTQRVTGGHLETGTSVFTFAVINIGVLKDGADLTRADDWKW